MTDEDRWPEIQATLRIEEALDSLGVEPVAVRGDEWFSHCPLPSHHGMDRNPSFSVNTDKLVFSCFSCGVGGTPIKLVMHILGVDYDEALDWLAQFSDYTVHDDAGFLEQIKRKLGQEPELWRAKGETVLPWYPMKKIDEWAQALQDNEDVWLNDSLYLDGRDRHISREVALHFKIGYDGEHRKGNYVAPAVILPVMRDGQCVGWQERWLGDRPDWLGKYTNTSDFPRAQVLYNGDMLAHWVVEGGYIVVESPMTVARLTTAGKASVATFGAKVSPGQIKLLRKSPELLLSFDNDLAGERALERLLDSLDDHTICHVVPPPSHEDKADLGDCDDGQLEATLAGAIPSLVYRSHL